VGPCYFAKQPPEIEVRGGLIFIRPEGSHCEVAVTPHTLHLFVARAQRALHDFHEENVVGLRASH